MEEAIIPQNTEQQDSENKQAMLAAIIDSSEDAIISKTLEGYITSWNGAAERMFGYKGVEVIGRHISLLIPREKLSEEDMIIGRIKNGLRVQHFQTTRVTKSGSAIPISLTVSPIKDRDGKIIGASKIARDITDLVRSQQELQMLYEKIQQLNLKKDEFIGVAGHELRTPITTIKGYLQLLESQEPEGTARQFAEKALRQVNKLNRLVNDLLDVSKITAGKLEYHRISCFLLPLIRDSLDTVRQIYTSHRLEAELPQEDLIITADGSKIEQVLINFLTNAVKYSPGADQVVLSVKKEANRVVVSIRDWGIGMAAEHLDQIFQRYYRIQSSEHAIGGLGIGLYISRDIIIRHGGEIWVESEEGKGSVFYFSLPLPE